jgi:large subunit ribosomal protein L31
MRADIHPKYQKLVATCSCGNVIETRSALGKETLYLDVCSACHPFYTGKQKNVDTGGRIDKFKQRFLVCHVLSNVNIEKKKTGDMPVFLCFSFIKVF